PACCGAGAPSPAMHRCPQFGCRACATAAPGDQSRFQAPAPGRLPPARPAWRRIQRCRSEPRSACRRHPRFVRHKLARRNPASAGSIVFALATIAFQGVRLPALPAYSAVVAALVIGILFMPRSGGPASTKAVAPDWDLPVRMLLATGLVLVLTGIAPRIGAHL